MSIQTFTKPFNLVIKSALLSALFSALAGSQLGTYRFKQAAIASKHVMGASLAFVFASVIASLLVVNTALAEPALMQPVEDIQFKEIPPPWLASEGSGSTVKNVVPASSQPVIKQTPKPVVRAPAQRHASSTPKPTSGQTTIESLIHAANKGDRNAQYDLGMRYQYGNGVKKSRIKAHRWLSKSAQAGNPQAQYALSLFYQQYARNAQGTKKALLWIKKAADQGLADAQYSLGMMFRNGSLVHKNPVEARKWLRKASNQGHVAAQLALSN